MLQSAGLTEVVAAPGGQRERHSQHGQHGDGGGQREGRDSLGDNGALEGVPADEALEGQVLIVTAHLVVLAI